MNMEYESYGKMVWRRFRRHRLASVSLVLLILIGGAALFAPVLAPYDPEAIAGPFAAPPSPARREKASRNIMVSTPGSC